MAEVTIQPGPATKLEKTNEGPIINPKAVELSVYVGSLMKSQGAPGKPPTASDTASQYIPIVPIVPASFLGLIPSGSPKDRATTGDSSSPKTGATIKSLLDQDSVPKTKTDSPTGFGELPAGLRNTRFTWAVLAGDPVAVELAKRLDAEASPEVRGGVVKEATELAIAERTGSVKAFLDGAGGKAITAEQAYRDGFIQAAKKALGQIDSDSGYVKAGATAESLLGQDAVPKTTPDSTTDFRFAEGLRDYPDYRFPLSALAADPEAAKAAARIANLSAAERQHIVDFAASMAKDEGQWLTFEVPNAPRSSPAELFAKHFIALVERELPRVAK